MPQTIDTGLLEVRTYTGDIRPFIQLEPGEPLPGAQTMWGCIEWDRFPAECEEAGAVRLVAVTEIEAGKDPVSTYCSGIPESLKVLHTRMTEMVRSWWAEFRR